jgi:exonuclease VII large subunit
MSLERIIAEQQQKIDDLTIGNKKLIERAANVFKRNSDLFEVWARFLDADHPTQEQIDEGHSISKIYFDLRHEVRMQMMEAGYCLRCYEFICQCEDQYD